MLTAKLFTNGSSQAVRLPKKVRFHGTEVYVQKDGTSLMLVPKEKAWENFMEGIDSFTNDYFDLVQSRREKESVPEEIEAL